MSLLKWSVLDKNVLDDNFSTGFRRSWLIFSHSIIWVEALNVCWNIVTSTWINPSFSSYLDAFICPWNFSQISPSFHHKCVLTPSMASTSFFPLLTFCSSLNENWFHFNYANKYSLLSFSCSSALSASKRIRLLGYGGLEVREKHAAFWQILLLISIFHFIFPQV